MERQRIEEILANVVDQQQYGAHLATLVADRELAPILRLALAAMPRIEWKDNGGIGLEDESYANAFGYRLTIWRTDCGQVGWSVVPNGGPGKAGTADSLEAAKAAAEAALRGLIRGEK